MVKTKIKKTVRLTKKGKQRARANKKRAIIYRITQQLQFIKNNATADELSQLDLESFDPCDQLNCILGQIATYSNSVRACSLAQKTRFMPSEFEKYLMYVGSKTHQKIFEYLQGEASTIELPLNELFFADNYSI
jgi:hypothetical protein